MIDDNEEHLLFIDELPNIKVSSREYCILAFNVKERFILILLEYKLYVQVQYECNEPKW